jgi:rhodanese-related sulfurtransferase
MTLRQALGVFLKGSLGLLSIWWSPAGRAAEDGLQRMKDLVHERFPDVRHLTPAELAAWMADTNRMPPLLLDVRTRAEYGVSHLPGARQVDPESPAARLLPMLPTNAPVVVVYCSVGYRSADCATRLLRAGFTNVLNLEGSIFQWANEGRPLESEGRPVRLVHPYSEGFGKLLLPELRAPATPREP